MAGRDLSRDEEEERRAAIRRHVRANFSSVDEVIALYDRVEQLEAEVSRLRAAVTRLKGELKVARRT